MTRGLDTMQDLDTALSKSLDEMIRENKSSRRSHGHGRGRGRGELRNSGQMDNKQDGREREKERERGKGRERGGGHFVRRNRYSAQQQQQQNRYKSNFNNKNNNWDTSTNNNNNNNSHYNNYHRGGRKGRMGRGFRRGYSTISSRGMKRSFNNNNNNSQLSRRSDFRRGSTSQRLRKSVSPTRRNNHLVSGAVIVHGLLPHVTSDDIKEIFETIGVVTEAFVIYNGQTGKSTGVAEIIYADRNDARKAQQELNGKLVDQVPISVRLASQSSSAQTRSRSMLTKGKFKSNPETSQMSGSSSKRRTNPNVAPPDPPNPLQR